MPYDGGIKKIPLAKGKFFTLVDDEDYEELAKYNWYITNPHNDKPKYAVRFVFLHKELLKTTSRVDHLNGDSLDNRRSNLRPCSMHQNNWNIKKRKGRMGEPPSSKYKGVMLHAVGGRGKSKWRAKITCNGVKHDLGYFDDEEAAARAYDTKAKELFGEFAWLNFPS